MTFDAFCEKYQLEGKRKNIFRNYLLEKYFDYDFPETTINQLKEMELVKHIENLHKGNYYKYFVEGSVCYIYSISDNEFVGSVWIDNTGAWNPNYVEDVTYLPINSALRLLGYPESENNTIE